MPQTCVVTCDGIAARAHAPSTNRLPLRCEMFRLADVLPGSKSLVWSTFGQVFVVNSWPDCQTQLNGRTQLDSQLNWF